MKKFNKYKELEYISNWLLILWVVFIWIISIAGKSNIELILWTLGFILLKCVNIKVFK